jgi:hypothetical protein
LVVYAIAEAMFSEDGEVDAVRLDAQVDAAETHISAASRAVRLGLRVALVVVRLAPILFFVGLTTFERLPLPARVALLGRLERSRRAMLSLAFIGWRTILTLLFYEDPAELRALGYAGDDRHRHRRALPLAPAGVPVPLESGVRLRDPSSTPVPAAPVVASRKDVA